MTKLTPPLKWHGGKHYLAKQIVELMPPHTHYVEPYFGGGAVLLEKDPTGVSEVVNDINGELTNFWDVLRSPVAFPLLKRQCEAAPFSEILFRREVAEEFYRGDAVDRAWYFFSRCRQSRAGAMKEFATLSRTRTRRGMNEQASAWLTAIEGLPQIHARLQRVVILNRDAYAVIQQQDGPDTLFYCDPPYLHETRATPDVYEYEITEQDHYRLLELLGSIKGKFILSGYPSDLYNSRAKMFGWNRKDIQIDNKVAGGKTKRRMTECLWMNF